MYMYGKAYSGYHCLFLVKYKSSNLVTFVDGYLAPIYFSNQLSKFQRKLYVQI